MGGVLKKSGKIDQFYPKSEEIRTRKIFKRVGVDIEFIVLNPNVARKRTIYMIGGKF